jgi:phospholipase C
VLSFKDCRDKEARTKYSSYDNLAADLAAGDMPEFTWIEPAYFSTPMQPATDQHPDHDVSLGEEVIKEIYESLRASPIWDDSVFIITYDEHGGFFDHVKPPTNVPNPDGKVATDDPFDFTRLGVRIPTVIVSPFIEKGSVFHAPPPTLDENNQTSSQYDHTSIISTVVHKLFQPAEGYPAPEYLTKRDEWAKTFEDVFKYDTGARKDCVQSLPEVFSHKLHFPETLPHSEGRDFLTDLQEELLVMLGGAAGEGLLSRENMKNWSEADGKAYCQAKMKAFLNAE